MKKYITINMTPFLIIFNNSSSCFAQTEEFTESAPAFLTGPRFGVSIRVSYVTVGMTVLLAVLLSSCTHYYYVANVQNVPLFKEINEFRISGSVGSGDESTSIEVQTAYSVTDKIGVMANYMSAKGGNISSNNYGSGNYFEGAVGYYKPFSRFGVFETYAGLGFSNQHHEYGNFYYNQSIGNSDLSSAKFYIQPSLGFTSKFFDIAVSTRISALTFNVKSNNVRDDNDLFNELNSLSTQIHGYIEPAVTIRAGWQYLKVQFQAEYSRNLIPDDMSVGEHGHISIGLYFSFGKRFDHQSQKKITE
jgi:hypothetical protein